MTAQGEFRDLDENIIKVVITSSNIGSDITIDDCIGTKVAFAGDTPIEIESECDDLFTHIIKQSCTINLVTKDYVGDAFFALEPRSVSVKVYKNDKIIFDGYVTPNTYNQDYNGVYDAFSLNCVDKLSVLESYRYDDIYTEASYNAKYALADIVSFMDILTTCCSDGNIYWDKSKSISGDTAILNDLMVNEVYMLGNDYDSTWTLDQALESVLKYLNLHIIQYGSDYYIFDWKSLVNGQTTWYNMADDSTVTMPTELSDYSRKDADTNITIGEVYNYLKLTCNLDSQDEIFKTPFDDDALESEYTNRNKYIYECQYNEDEAQRAYHNWYVRFMNNKNWAFRFYDKIDKKVRDISDILHHDANGVAIDQSTCLDLCHEWTHIGGLASVLFKAGKCDAVSPTDNQPHNNLSMDTLIGIVIKGIGKTIFVEKDYSQSKVRWELWDEATRAFYEAGGMIEYTSPASVTSIVPPDSGTTNYIVFSGTFYLQPMPQMTIGIESPTDQQLIITGFKGTYPGEATADTGYNFSCFLPPLGYDWKNMYDSYGIPLNITGETATDYQEQIPILVCEMKIGDKYCVETTGTNCSEYKWMTQEEAAAAGYEAVFTLGFNPKYNDYLLCSDYAFSNNITPEMNLDNVEGTAIPIKSTDGLSGQIEFRVLRPYYYNFDQNVYKSPTFWRHSSWSTKTVPLMELVDMLYVKSFECKICSDAGLLASLTDNDLIYSTEDVGFYHNQKDDLEFDWITQPTSAECYEKGLNNTVNTNAVQYKEALIVKLDGDTYNKAEEQYLEEYYNYYSQPKIELETTINDSDIPFTINQFPILPFKDTDKKTVIKKWSRDLKMNSTTLTIREF